MGCRNGLRPQRRTRLNLMSHALVLKSAGRSRRAYALGIIAVEEAAKSLRLCRSRCALNWKVGIDAPSRT